ADLRDCRRIARVDCEIGPYRLGALDEQRHRVVLRERLQVGQRVRVRELERRNLVLVLTGQPQWSPAGDQQLHPRRREERRQLRGSVEYLLEVVEKEQQASIADEIAEGVGESRSSRLVDPERLCDRRQYQRGVVERLERDEEDPV